VKRAQAAARAAELRAAIEGFLSNCQGTGTARGDRRLAVAGAGLWRSAGVRGRRAGVFDLLAVDEAGGWR
jgi:hypothetical protein